MLPITHLNYDLDLVKVLEIANLVKRNCTAYDSSAPNWKWGHKINHSYLHKIKSDLDIYGWIDFYFQEPNSFLAPHIDPVSKCAINFVLTPDPAPITFYKDAKSIDDLGAPADYHYIQAVLNTRVCHSVQTTDSERILLKICSTENYESVVSKMKKYGKVA